MATSLRPMAAFVQRGEDPKLSGDHEKRAAIGSSHPRLAGGDTRKRAVVQRIRGNSGSECRVCGASSAHSQHLKRCFCRGGGGNTTGSDVMWVDGRVQSAIAHAAYGVGVYVEAAGFDW